MHNKVLYFLVIGLLVSGCAVGKNPSSNAYPDAFTPTRTQMAITKPLLYGWELPEDAQISGKEWALKVYGFILGESEITLLYSLSGLDSEQLTARGGIQVADDAGRVSRPLWILPLAQLDGLELGVMSFEPRRPRAENLFLLVAAESAEVGALETVFARFYTYGPSSQPDTLACCYYGQVLPDWEPWKQGEYLISFAGFWIPPDFPVPGVAEKATQAASYTPNAGATPEAFRPTPWIELPSGIFIRDEASFRIQNLETGQIEYLAIQLLTNGEAVGFFKGSVVHPTPLLAEPLPAAVTPGSQTYP